MSGEYSETIDRLFGPPSPRSTPRAPARRPSVAFKQPPQEAVDAAGDAMLTPTHAALVNFNVQREYNAEQFGRASQLAKQTGVPAEVALRNLDQVQRIADTTSLTQIVENDALFARWAALPERAGLVENPAEAQGLTDLRARFQQWSQPTDLSSARGALDAAGRELQPGFWRAAPARVGSGLTWRASGLAASALETIYGLASDDGGTLAGMLGTRLGAWAASRAGQALWHEWRDNPLSRMFEAENQRLAAEWAAIPPEERGNMVSRYFGAWRDYSNIRADDVTRRNRGGGFFSEAVLGGLESLPVSLASMVFGGFAARGLGPVMQTTAAVAPLGLMVGGDAYQRALDAGLPPDSAARYATTDALAEVAFEAIPGLKLFQNLAIGTPFVRTLATNMLQEFVTEGATQAVQSFNEQMTLNPDRPFGEWFRELPDEMLAAAIGGATMSVATTTPLYGLERAARRIAGEDERAAQAQEVGAFLGEVAKTSAASQVRERDPQSFAEFVEMAAEGGPAETIFIRADALVDVLNQSGMDLGRLEILSPAAAEQLQAALATGQDVAIPVGEFAAGFATTDMSAALLQHAKIDPAGMSIAEAETYMQERGDAVMQELADTAARIEQDGARQASADAVRADVQAQLEATGRYAGNTAQAQAALWQHFFATMGERLGVDPLALYQRFQPRIQAQAPSGGAMVDQTPAEKSRWVADLEGAGGRENVRGFAPLGEAPPALVSAGLPQGPLRFGRSKIARVQREHDISLSVLRDLGDLLADPRAVFPSSDPNKPGALVVVLNARDDEGRPIIAVVGPTAEGNTIFSVYGKDGRAGGAPEDAVRAMIAAAKRRGAQVFEKEGGVPAPSSYSGPIPDMNQEKRAPKPILSIPRRNKDELFQTAPAVGDTIEVDGVERPTTNSNGQPIHATEDGLRNFWRWFGDSRVVDDQGRPLVVYHGTNANAYSGDDRFQIFNTQPPSGRGGAFFTDAESAAAEYGEDVYATYLRIASPLEVRADGRHWAALDADTPIAGEATAELLAARSALAADIDALAAELFGDDAPSAAIQDESGSLDGRTLGHIPDLTDGGAVETDQIARRARNLGFDGVVFRDVRDSPTAGAGYANAQSDVFVVFSPEQIKSIDNIGAFSSGEGNIFRQRALGAFQPSTNTISLLAGANLSTFLHESGHFFLNVMEELASDPTMPDSVRQEFDKLLPFLGAESLAEWRGWTLEQKREGHEKFARGFEAWLFSGRAPSLATESIFRRFAGWLKAVYQTLKNLNVQLTPEVRGVMERMLATDDAIADAQAAASLGLAFQNAEQAGMTGAEWRAYQALDADAQAQAQAELGSKWVRDLQWYANAKAGELRRLQRRNAELRKAVRAEVAAEIMAEPVHRARTWLQRGVNPDGTAFDGPHRLSIAEVDALLAERADASDVKRKLGYGQYGMLARENAIHPAQVAELFGFPDAVALIDALANAESARERIEAATDQRMLERYGDITDAATLSAEADAAVHSALRGRVLATELNALARATGKPKLLADAARTFAENTIGRLALGQLRPHLYRAAESRAGRAALKALSKGNTQGAALEKRNQLMSFHLHQAAIRARRDAEAMQRLFARIVTARDDRVAKSRDMAFVQAARAILASYGYGRAKNDPAGYLRMLRDYDPQRYAALEDTVASVQGDGTRQLDELTINELRAIHDVVASLWKMSRADKKLMLDGQARDLDAVVNELVPILEKRAKHKPRTDQLPTEGEQRMRSVSGLFASVKRVEAWADALGPKFTSVIWRPISEAAESYRGDSARYIKAFRALYKGMEHRLTDTPIAAPELGFTFNSRASLLHAILHTGNDSNMRKLLIGRGWGRRLPDGAVDRARWDLFMARAFAEGIVTREDMDFVQAVWDLLEQTKPAAQAAHLAVYGHYFDEITAREVDTPFGTYRGGYVPAMADTFDAPDAGIRAEAAKLEDNASNMFPAPGSGFAKARVEQYAAPLALDLRHLPRHIDKVLLFAHMGPPSRDLMKLLRNQRFAAALHAYDPVAQTDLLLPWLNRATRQTVETPMSGKGGAAANHIARYLRSSAGMQLMVANVVNTFQQATGVFLAAAKVKPKYLAAAFVRMLFSPFKMIRAARASSQFMVNRTDSQAFAMRQELEQLAVGAGRFQRLQDWGVRHTYFLQTFFQNMIDPIVWHGAYEQAIANGANDKEAQRQADAAVRMTQGSMAAEDISNVESGNAFMRLFTQFFGYFNMQANLIGAEAVKTIDAVGLRRSAGRLFFLYVTAFMLPAVVGEAIAELMRGQPEDEDEDGYLDEWLQLFFGSQFRTAAAMVPVAGQVGVLGAESLWAAIHGEKRAQNDSRLRMSPALSLIETALGTPADIAKLFDEEEDVNARRLVRDGLTTLGLLTKLPTGAIGRPVSYAAGVANDDIEPTGPVDAVRGALSGVPSPESRQ